MTKKLRIENADVSKNGILVEHRNANNDLVTVTTLINPTDVAELFLHSDRYYVIKEVVLEQD